MWYLTEFFHENWMVFLCVWKLRKWSYVTEKHNLIGYFYHKSNLLYDKNQSHELPLTNVHLFSRYFRAEVDINK